MAYSIAKAITKSVRGNVGPGKSIKGSFPVKFRKSGNTKTFGRQKQGVRNGALGSINLGDNSGPVGF